MPAMPHIFQFFSIFCLDCLPAIAQSGYFKTQKKQHVFAL